MADNVRLDGIAKQATDYINGIHYPRVKIVFGPDGEAHDLGDMGLPVAPPRVTSATIVATQTHATGTNWVTIAAGACDAFDLVNTTGVTIEYRRNGAGSGFQIPNLSSRLIVGITNTNQIDIRRVDQDNFQVTIYGERFVY